MIPSTFALKVYSCSIFALRKSHSKRGTTTCKALLICPTQCLCTCLPPSNREGNAKQLSNITKAATSLELGLSQACRSIHERANDTIHAQIGQYMLLPDLFRVLSEQDPHGGTRILECQKCFWDKDKQQFWRCYIALSCMKHFWQ